MIPESVKEGWVIKEKDAGVRFRTFHIDGICGVRGNMIEDTIVGSVMAVTVPLNDEHTEFRTQFSYLSPREKRGFNRQTGKDVALARLNSDKSIIFLLGAGNRLGEALKNLIVMEAERKQIQWFDGVQEGNLV
jgi:hypothetical protein